MIFIFYEMKLETYESNLPSTKNNTCIKRTQILRRHESPVVNVV